MDFNEAYQKAIETYKKRTPESEKAYRQACEYLAGGECRSLAFFNPYPFTLKKAEGWKMYDLDGNTYIDFLSNYTSLIHGHAHPKHSEAITGAAALGTASPAGIEEQVILAKMICERVNSVDKIRFCNSGTEATMFAIRTAKAYTGRKGVIKMLGAYHGTHDVAAYTIEDAAEGVYIIPYNDLDAARKILKEHPEDIACVIVEPFLGDGIIPAKQGYLKGLRGLCDKYNVVYIMDEVQSFRLSTGGAQKKYNVHADLTTFAKIIGGGLPVGAFGGKNEIMSVFDHSKDNPLKQSGTFNGNRASMAGGIASLKMLDQSKIDYIDSLGERLELGFEKEIKKRKLPVSITREGSLLNIHMSSEKPYDYETACKSDNDILRLWYLEMLNRGVFPAPRGLFVISTVMTDEVIDTAASAFAGALDVIAPIFQGHRPSSVL
jgi:glutamate-1-semialdehyde 2,1-aminomutase